MRIFGVIPLYQVTKRHLNNNQTAKNDEKKKIRMYCFVLINSVLLNLLCVWILVFSPVSSACTEHGGSLASPVWHVGLVLLWAA